ncbi:MAG: formylglycine-generating enzyme family protein [Crocinitomicaceae bacterium]|nr:formylglycine-generating enzyme family protein [Crocinitomicaceae bacterium]
MIGIIGLVVSVVIYIGTYEETGKLKVEKEFERIEIDVIDESTYTKEILETSEKKHQDPLTEPKSVLVKETDNWEKIPTPVGFKIPICTPRREPRTDLNANTDKFIFPTLNKKEILATKKQKNKMLKALAKNDNKVYEYVPSGSFRYKSKVVSVQSFIIQRSEVSNLEYRTFLFDLLIQGRKAEFKLAAPSQEKWTELFGEEMRGMQNEYFSDPKFDAYPVCNVSPEGVNMYCKWLTLELNKSDYKKKMKMLLNDIRLPHRVEWVKAVSKEGKHLPYPWKGDSVLGKYGFFAAANFKLPEVHDSVRVVDPNAITTLGFMGAGSIFVKADFHWKEEDGLYNACGNVAELVCETNVSSSDLTTRKDGEYGTAGGGWMNTAEEIKILNEDLHKGINEGHPNVGFRVVMTYMKKGAPVGVMGD